jgi:hypothetical protein
LAPNVDKVEVDIWVVAMEEFVESVFVVVDNNYS